MYILNAQTKQLAKEFHFDGLIGPIVDMKFVVPQTLFAFASYVDNKIALVETNQLNIVQLITTTHTAMINRIAVWSPLNQNEIYRYIITASDDKSSEIWYVDSSSYQFSYRFTATSEIKDVIVLSNRKVAYACNNAYVIIENIVIGQTWKTLSPGGGIQAVSVAQLDEDVLAVGEATNTIRIWTISTGSVLYTLVGSWSYVSNILPYTDNNLVATYKGQITLWNWRTQTVINSLGEYDTTTIINRADISSNSVISVVNSQSASQPARLINSTNNNLTFYFGSPGTIQMYSTMFPIRTSLNLSYVYNCESSDILVGGMDNYLSLYSMSNASLIQNLNLFIDSPTEKLTCLLSIDSFVYAVGTSTNKVYFLTKNLVRKFSLLTKHTQGIKGMAWFNNSNSEYILVTASESIKFWNLNKHYELEATYLPGTYVFGGVIATNGYFAAWYDSTITVGNYGSATYAIRITQVVNSPYVITTAVAVSLDEFYIGDSSGTITVFSISSLSTSSTFSIRMSSSVVSMFVAPFDSSNSVLFALDNSSNLFLYEMLDLNALQANLSSRGNKQVLANSDGCVVSAGGKLQVDQYYLNTFGSAWQLSDAPSSLTIVPGTASFPSKYLKKYLKIYELIALFNSHQP